MSVKIHSQNKDYCFILCQCRGFFLSVDVFTAQLTPEKKLFLLLVFAFLWEQEPLYSCAV